MSEFINIGLRITCTSLCIHTYKHIHSYIYIYIYTYIYVIYIGYTCRPGVYGLLLPGNNPSHVVREEKRALALVGQYTYITV